MAPAAAWVILIALVLLILLNISMLIHSIAKAPCCKYTTSCGQLLQKVLRSGRVRKEDDPMLRHVYKKMFHVWVCRARVVAWYGAVFTSLSNLPVLLMHGLTRGEDGTLQSANFRGQDLIVLLFLALTTLLARCPRLVTGRSLGALYVLFFALLVAFWLCREANNRIFQATLGGAGEYRRRCLHPHLHHADIRSSGASVLRHLGRGVFRVETVSLGRILDGGASPLI
mmetsp:Transcript_38281/g.81117  ORF Transcript_38281/g.81117 Transcript_38281/m.81117 type:complete len:227 (+) Transcript_38281:132-812(+)